MLDPDPEVAPVMPPVIAPKVQEKVEGIFDVRLKFVDVPVQIVSALLLVTKGFGCTVTVIVKGLPGQDPAIDVGVTMYSTVPSDELDGFERTWLIVAPDDADAPVIPSVIFPIVQLKLLGRLAVSAILTEEALQILFVGEFVTIGVPLIVTAVVVLLQFVVLLVKVNVALPGLTPVMIPASVTVAIASLLLTQVPPVVGDKVAVLPTHTAGGAFTIGLLLKLTFGVVFLQPVEVCVKVKLALPALNALTTPAFVILATEVLLLIHVPPEVGDIVYVDPTHIEAGADTAGISLMAIALVETVQPDEV